MMIDHGNERNRNLKTEYGVLRTMFVLGKIAIHSRSGRKKQTWILMHGVRDYDSLLVFP